MRLFNFLEQRQELFRIHTHTSPSDDRRYPAPRGFLAPTNKHTDDLVAKVYISEDAIVIEK